MAGRDIIVVGASAGGVEALAALARGLPPDLPAAVFVVLHVPAHGTSVMPQILSRNGPLPAAHPRHGDPIERGRIYVAPPDNHLLIRRGRVELSRGPRENGARPSVDPLFRSAARAYGPRVIGAVLSGALDDGTAGLQAIKQRGGLAVVQDPETATFEGMPRSAVQHIAVDHCLPVEALGPLLARLAREPVDEAGFEPEAGAMEWEVRMAEMDHAAADVEGRPGQPSGYGCPECNGALWEMQDGALVRYRCRVGHAYSADSLLAEQSEALEAALWVALRALEESASLSDRLYHRALDSGRAAAAERFRAHARDAEQRAELIRGVIANGRGVAVHDLNGDGDDAAAPAGSGAHGSNVQVGSEP